MKKFILFFLILIVNTAVFGQVEDSISISLDGEWIYVFDKSEKIDSVLIAEIDSIGTTIRTISIRDSIVTYVCEEESVDIIDRVLSSQQSGEGGIFNLHEHQWINKPFQTENIYVDTYVANDFQIFAEKCPPEVKKEYERICKICLLHEYFKWTQLYKKVAIHNTEFSQLLERIKSKKK